MSPGVRVNQLIGQLDTLPLVKSSWPHVRGCMHCVDSQLSPASSLSCSNSADKELCVDSLTLTAHQQI